jgi:predicted RNA methylase
MVKSSLIARSLVIALVLIVPAAAGAQDEPFVPQPGQPGKDVVWVPTPPELVERMLDLAAVTPQDFVIDLGSGDGRNVIGAARRGAQAMGVEFNPNMVALSATEQHAAAAPEVSRPSAGHAHRLEHVRHRGLDP